MGDAEFERWLKRNRITGLAAAAASRKRRAGRWLTLCKRTNYPKLGYIIDKLKRHHIPCRFNGRSFHADHILEVPEHLYVLAMGVLEERHGRYRLDDVRDDHPKFNDYAEVRP